MNPSGTLVLSPPGSEQGEARRRGPTGLQMPRNPTGLKMPEEENTLPSRFDRNIEKVYPVLGHRFVAKVGIHLPWWWQLFVLFFAGLQTVCLLCCGQGVHMGFWETSNLLLLIPHRACILFCKGLVLWTLWNDHPLPVLQEDRHSLFWQHVRTSSTSECCYNLFRLSEAEGKEKLNVECGIAHNFKLTTYKMLTYCELCGSLLWGLARQGYQCTNLNCRLNVHEGCREVRKYLPPMINFTFSQECSQPSLRGGQNPVCSCYVPLATEGTAENQDPDGK